MYDSLLYYEHIHVINEYEVCVDNNTHVCSVRLRNSTRRVDNISTKDGSNNGF